MQWRSGGTVPNKPCGFCGRKHHERWRSGASSLISLMVSVDVKHHERRRSSRGTANYPSAWGGRPKKSARPRKTQGATPAVKAGRVQRQHLWLFRPLAECFHFDTISASQRLRNLLNRTHPRHLQALLYCAVPVHLRNAAGYMRWTQRIYMLKEPI